MNIRIAEKKDTEKILELLSQVLEIHAKARPDVFISGTTKYTAEELEAIFKDENRRTYVATDDDGTVLGYAFCEIQMPEASNNLHPHTTLYIDDICVSESARGMHIGTGLYEYVLAQAKALGCYNVTLNVWEGNDTAKAFYKKMGMKIRKTQMEAIL
ncbi:MAG: GNAT family N-acetyltransferase [Eubacterium sp.]|nr:GNAT family N-acetyltransferase [Eubacterium sp.]